jgi:hypothetical protein
MKGEEYLQANTTSKQTSRLLKPRQLLHTSCDTSTKPFPFLAIWSYSLASYFPWEFHQIHFVCWEGRDRERQPSSFTCHHHSTSKSFLRSQQLLRHSRNSVFYETQGFNTYGAHKRASLVRIPRQMNPVSFPHSKTQLHRAKSFFRSWQSLTY